MPEPSFKDRASIAGVTEAVSLSDLDISWGWDVYKGFGAAVLDLVYGIGATVQKRLGQHKERTRGFAGYYIAEDRDNNYSF